MILVDISLSLSDSSRYSIKVTDRHIPKGETPFSEKALNVIIKYLNTVLIVLPDAISIEKDFHFFLSYHENAKLTSKISGNMPKEMFLSQDDLAQKLNDRAKDTVGDNQIKGEGQRYPILHMSSANMLSGDKRIIHNIRYYNIMDSSIWNYYISFQDLYSSDGIARLSYIFEQMVQNQINQLYELRISTEYADLNARIVKGDYTDPIGHGSHVSPFLFHSEWKMKKMYERILKLNPAIVKQHWRFLLLDDCVMDSLRLHSGVELKFDTEKKDIIGSSKLAIVKKSIERIPNIFVSWRYYSHGQLVAQSSKENEEKSCVQVWCVKSIDDALLLLKSNKFDIILLDYLLGEHSITDELICKEAINQGLSEAVINEMVRSLEEDKYSSSREYGYQLLKRLKYLLSTKTSYQGPVGGQYFMFISAFTTAVDERLRAEGLNRGEKFWHIAEGACPTNTPQLFLYNLLKLMEKRLNVSGILKLSSNEIYELVNKIYLPQEKDFPRYDPVRKRANALYQKVLSLQYHYRSILKDVEIPFGQNASEFDTKGSVMMTHFIQKKVNLGGMLEHLTQLVHLTAFGTVRQWPEMWEEYIYFKAQFKKQVEIDNDSVDTKTLFSYIEKYILDLKSQQR